MLNVMSNALVINVFLGYDLVKSLRCIFLRPEKEGIPPLAVMLLWLARKIYRRN